MLEPYNLHRFITAQERDYSTALVEIKEGHKRSHWMWYIFPQIQGLGLSGTSKYYAIKDLAEAEAYLSHPVLGCRLIEICHALLEVMGSDAHAIFGSPDDMKLRSSMTLFAAVAGADVVFRDVLDKFFGGTRDATTMQLIQRQQ